MAGWEKIDTCVLFIHNLCLLKTSQKFKTIFKNRNNCSAAVKIEIYIERETGNKFTKDLEKSGYLNWALTWALNFLVAKGKKRTVFTVGSQRKENRKVKIKRRDLPVEQDGVPRRKQRGRQG